MARNRLNDLRRRVYQVLEQGPVGDRVSTWVDRALVMLIVVNLAAVALESIPQYRMRYATAFVLIEYVSLLVFTVEYGLRLWCAVEHGPYRHLRHSRARMKYALSPAGIIDLIAVLPFWFAMLLPSDLRFVLVFRMVRFFKIARYSPAMRSLLDVLYNQRRGLVGCLIIALGTALVAASLMHLAEAKIQPDKLGTISRCVLVGDRDHRHDRLRRRGAGDRAWQADCDGDDFCRTGTDGSAGRHHRYGLR